MIAHVQVTLEGRVEEYLRAWVAAAAPPAAATCEPPDAATCEPPACADSGIDSGIGCILGGDASTCAVGGDASTCAVPATCAVAPIVLERLDRRLDPLRGR